MDDAAIQLAYASSVIVVPGYGLAVAQAQHGVRELAELLESRGVDVKYAIHPVAGRMPGHMNVLLAEANVPYPQLREMDDINPEFDRCDVALVIGANDVTNPAARRPGSPVSGMPILDVDHAKNIIVMKRSMGRGYAGIDNELYMNPKTGMLFADAKAGARGADRGGQGPVALRSCGDAAGGPGDFRVFGGGGEQLEPAREVVVESRDLGVGRVRVTRRHRTCRARPRTGRRDGEVEPCRSRGPWPRTTGGLGPAWTATRRRGPGARRPWVRPSPPGSPWPSWSRQPPGSPCLP